MMRRNAAQRIALCGLLTALMLVLGLVENQIPLNASIPGLMGQSIFGLKDSGAISATLMTAVYVGQALYAPIMARFLPSEGGMASGWLFFAGAAILGMVLILVAIAISPMKKLSRN